MNNPTIAALINLAWRWGHDCEVDGLHTMEAIGDSHNESQREDTAKLAATIEQSISDLECRLAAALSAKENTRLALEQMRAERDQLRAKSDASLAAYNALREALLGPCDVEMLGRFSWLEAFMIDFDAMLTARPDIRATWLEADASATLEAEDAVRALIADVHPLLRLAHPISDDANDIGSKP